MSNGEGSTIIKKRISNLRFARSNCHSGYRSLALVVNEFDRGDTRSGANRGVRADCIERPRYSDGVRLGC